MNKGIYENIAIYVSSLHPGGLRLTARAARKAGLHEGMTVLDIGCGCGESLALLRREFSVRTIGVDVSKQLIDSARSRHGDIEVYCADAAEFLRSCTEQYDAVLAECTLSLIGDILPDIHKVLKDEGTLIVSDLYDRGKALQYHESFRRSGFEIVFSEEHTDALRTYAAELAAEGQCADGLCGGNTSYMLTICKKV